MKLKQTIAVSILAIAGLTSCEKDLYDPTQEKPVTKVEDLNIADDFDWKMSQSSLCNIQSGNSTVTLSIYQNEACTSENLLAIVPVLPGSNPKLPLSVLSTNQEVYITYQNSANETIKTAASIVDGNINFTVPNQATARSTRAGEIEENGIITTFYPNFEGGTVMFEDNYPELGDYDFNDFVAKYMVEIHTDAKTNYVKDVNLYLSVRAIGAIKKYIPHFRIISYGTSYVESIDSNKGIYDDFNPQLIPDDKGKIVIALNGAENKFGEEYLNTKEGTKAIPTRKLDTTIRFKEGTCDIAFLEIDKFDLFLASADHKEEIHILGNGPAFKSEGYGNASYYKDSKTNLVWGINIPEVINHTYEQANFLEAYPEFAKWAEGNYSATNKWYKNGVSKFLYPMNY